MEYIDGGTLADLLKEKGAMDENIAVKYTREIGDALSYIHHKQMNHLDVKPANVLIRNNGDLVLIDFGLSKRYDEKTGEQTSTTPVGISVGYAPIEQSRIGGVIRFSPATDVYSLGATLYKMVTGNTPPDAASVMDDGLPPFSDNVSPEIQKAIVAAMQPRRVDRPQQVVDFLNMLPPSENVVLKETIPSDNKGNKTETKDESTIILPGNERNQYAIEMVDLGLNVMWANLNIGTSSINPQGELYAWGDVSIKSDDISGTEHDICTSHNSNWRMPRIEDWEELLNKCRWNFDKEKNGYIVTGPNGNHIFLPCAGRSYGEDVVFANYGYYWTSNAYKKNANYAYYIFLSSTEKTLTTNDKVVWRSVRAVMEKLY
jgi:uncharacterized protein (TIGR02145 family)